MTTAQVTFLLDVDNTLLDNDHFERDLRSHLQEKLGVDGQARYWHIFEGLRAELGYADYLGAVQRLRVEDLHEPRLLELSSFLLEYPFGDRLYPKALEVIARLRDHGPVVVLSDGDAIFQPRKIERSGLFSAAGGHVLIYIHKDQETDDIAVRYPASHYVLIDDKPVILAAVKNTWGSRVTTVCPRQGHYALDPKSDNVDPRPDVSIEHIGDLLHVDLFGTAREIDVASEKARPSRRSPS